MRRTALALLLSAGPALAEGPLLTITFPDDMLIVPQGTPVAAEATLDQTGNPAVLARLPEPQATRLSALTKRHVGRIVTIGFCGDELSRPLLQTPIASGTLVVTGAGTAEAATRIAASLTAGRCDAP